MCRSSDPASHENTVLRTATPGKTPAACKRRAPMPRLHCQVPSTTRGRRLHLPPARALAPFSYSAACWCCEGLSTGARECFMIVIGSEEIKGLLGSRGITLFFFGSEGGFGVFSPSTGHWPSLSVRAKTFFRFCRSPGGVLKYRYDCLISSLHSVSWI